MINRKKFNFEWCWSNFPNERILEVPSVSSDEIQILIRQKVLKSTDPEILSIASWIALWIASRITWCIASGWPNGQKDDPIDNLEDKCGKFKRVNRNQVKSKLFKRLNLCTLGALIWSRLGCTGNWVSTAIGLQFIGMIAMQSISNQRDQWNLFEWYLLMGSDWWPILTADSLDSILWIPKRSFNEMWTSRRTRCTHLGCKFLWNSFGIAKSIVDPTITAYGHDSLTIFWAKFVPAGHRRSCREILGKHSREAFSGSIPLIPEKDPFQESPLLEQPMRTSKHLPNSLKPELRILHIRAGKGVVNSFRGTEFRNFKV